MDSNEDGFNADNVTAICKIGQSTKSRSAHTNQGFIGEKGIGFKSVFKIANKVYVKSEPYSFSFHYLPNSRASGLGMITPICEDYDDMPASGTRIILTEIKDTSFEELQKEFERIPDTLLLFLNTLKVLVVRFQLKDRIKETRYVHTVVGSDKFQDINITKVEYSAQNRSCVYPGSKSTRSLRFYVAEKRVDGLPPDEARKTAEGEHITSSTVVLAFPVSKNNEPKIKEQHVYAFLPLRKAGFPVDHWWNAAIDFANISQFLLQADFIVTSTREDVQYSSPRNRSLLSAAADLFCDAVKFFCQSSGDLRHTWVRYLPGASIDHDFWKDLYPQIKDQLSTRDVLYAWTDDNLYHPSKLFKLPPSMLDEDGQPLLQDFDDIRYLSCDYEEEDCLRLQELGTRSVNHEEFLQLLKHDLKYPCDPISRWKQLKRSTEWQKKTAQVMLEMCETSQSEIDRDTYKRTLQSLHLVPVSGSGWCTMRNRDVFMPTVANVSIPADLGLNLAKPLSLLVPERKQLMQALGVKNAKPSAVIKAIHDRYDDDAMPVASIEDSVTHFKFLFHQFSKAQRKKSRPSRLEQSDSAATQKLPQQMMLLDQDATYVPRDKPLYFRNPDDPLGAENLFMEDDNTGDPGLQVRFLHENYLTALSPDDRSSDPSWIHWLEEATGIRHSPELTTQKAASGSRTGHVTLSREFKYIIRKKPNLLVDVLEHYQDIYFPVASRRIAAKLSGAQVPVGNGLKLALKETCLPTQKLEQIANELDIPDTCSLPFLDIESPIADDSVTRFKFLEKLGVVTNETLEFYLRILLALTNWAGEDDSDNEEEDDSDDDAEDDSDNEEEDDSEVETEDDSEDEDDEGEDVSASSNEGSLPAEVDISETVRRVYSHIARTFSQEHRELIKQVYLR